MLVLTQDYTFASPSMAAGVLLGRTANGRTEWKDAKGRTLKKLQEAEDGGKNRASERGGSAEDQKYSDG